MDEVKSGRPDEFEKREQEEQQGRRRSHNQCAATSVQIAAQHPSG
jgi:hypothetical protein